MEGFTKTSGEAAGPFVRPRRSKRRRTKQNAVVTPRTPAVRSSVPPVDSVYRETKVVSFKLYCFHPLNRHVGLSSVAKRPLDFRSPFFHPNSATRLILSVCWSLDVLNKGPVTIILSVSPSCCSASVFCCKNPVLFSGCNSAVFHVCLPPKSITRHIKAPRGRAGDGRRRGRREGGREGRMPAL